MEFLKKHKIKIAILLVFLLVICLVLTVAVVSFYNSEQAERANNKTIEHGTTVAPTTAEVSPTTADDAYEGWKTYESKTLGVKFKYPEDFKVGNERSVTYPAGNELTALFLWDLTTVDERYKDGWVIISFYNSLEDIEARTTLVPGSDYEPITIEGKKYEFKSYVFYEGNPCSQGGFIDYVVELSENLFVAITKNTQIDTCDEGVETLPESEWVKTVIPSEDRLKVARQVIESIELL